MLNKMGAEMTVEVRMIDVQDGTVVLRASCDIHCAITGWGLQLAHGSLLEFSHDKYLTGFEFKATTADVAQEDGAGC